MLQKALETLGFDNQETKVYLTLLKSGSLTVGNLARRLGVARTTLYGFLARLTDRGLVNESQRRGVKVFSAEAPEKILMLFSQKQAELDRAQSYFAEILPKLKSQSQTVLTSPRFQLYEGEEGLRNVLKDMLLYSDIESCSVWPIRQMLEILGPEFFQYHNLERIHKNIYTRAIWPQSEAVKIKDFQFLGSGIDFKREIRLAPKDMNFSMGYWFYANKVAFLASRKEGFGFILESQELVQTLQAQFEVIWNLASPIVCRAEDTKDFIKQLNS